METREVFIFASYTLRMGIASSATTAEKLVWSALNLVLLVVIGFGTVPTPFSKAADIGLVALGLACLTFVRARCVWSTWRAKRQKREPAKKYFTP